MDGVVVTAAISRDEQLPIGTNKNLTVGGMGGHFH